MRILALICIWLVAAAASAQTNRTWTAYRSPIRIFPGKAAVNLSPLFDWWQRTALAAANNNGASSSVDDTNAVDSDRPLSSWDLISGTKVAEMGPSWVVNAVIYTSPTVHTNARIILNHPPAFEEQAYRNLQIQLAQVDRQIDYDRQVYEANTNQEQRAMRKLEMYRRSLSKVASTGVNTYSRIVQEKHDTAAVALNQLDQLRATRAQIVRQLKQMPASSGIYHLEWFALDLGHTKQGVPLYDGGFPGANPLQ